MTRGLLLVADGADDTHVAYAYHRLREDAVLVDVATPAADAVDVEAIDRPAVPLAELPRARRYDLVVVPGGPAASGLAASGDAVDWLATYLNGDGVVCAIAEGVRALLEAGVADGRLLAAPASLEADVRAAGAEPSGEAVTVDGTVVTVAGTAGLPFGISAALGSVVIPQDRAAHARERPSWSPSDVA